MLNNPPNTLWIHGLMVVMIILVASSFPVAATITQALPPEVMMWLRFLLAALLFLPYVCLRHGLSFPPITQLWRYALLSIPLVVFFWCMFSSLRYTSAINTGAIYTTVPAITAVYAALINREVTGRWRALGLLLGTLGALWIVFRGDLEALMRLEVNRGDGIFLLGCLFMAAYNPLMKRFYQGEPMALLTFWVVLFGSGWLLLLSLPQLSSIHWSGVAVDAYLGIAYLALFTTLVTFFLMQVGTLRLGATRVAAYSFLTPVFVILLSVMSGLGQFEGYLLPGVLLVVVAMLLIQYESGRATPQLITAKS